MSSLTSVADSEEDSHQVVAILWKDLSAISKLFPESKQSHNKNCVKFYNHTPNLPSIQPVKAKTLRDISTASHPLLPLPRLTLEVKEHAREGWYSHKEVEDNTTVGVVGAIVVRLRCEVTKSVSCRTSAGILCLQVL